MTRQSLRRPTTQAGFTLAEILVATAVFLIIFLGAMMLYDRSNQVFKQGVEASDMQQNTRVAFDKVIADIRMAGYDFDRDGRPSGGIALAWRPSTLYGRGAVISPTDPTIAGTMTFRCDVAGKSGTTEPDWKTTYACLTGSECVKDAAPVVWVKRAGTAEYQQPDEQLEYVGRSAITVRANFNFEDPLSEDNGRESAYEPTKGQFPIVTTSNREIATYVLKSDRGKNEDDITFYADIKKPRNSFPGGDKEELVTLGKYDDCMTGGVWDGCKQPPYTLYRVTLDDAAKAVETPIASNIRSIRFTYYEDIAGTEALRDLASTPAVIPNGGAIGGNGQYDPADGSVIIADRLIRQKIKSIGVELVGMGEAPDFNYTNPDETASAYTDTAGRLIEPTRYRQYRIESLVSPRNIGKHGMREQDVLPPGPPVLRKLLIGSCGIVDVQWDPPSSGASHGAVEQYQVEWKQCTGATDCNFTGTFTSEPPTVDTTYQVQNLDPAFKYIFRVKAFNGYGSDTSKETGFWDAPLNRTKPEVPSGLLATSTKENLIDLKWTRPLASVSGDYRTVTSGATEPAGTIVGSEILGYEIYRSETTPVATIAANLISTGPLSTDPISGAVSYPDSNIVNCKTYYYKIRAVEKCFAKDSYNEGPAPDKSYAASDFTAEVSAAATSTATPGMPADLTLKGSNNPDGKTYDILLQWPQVNKDASGTATLNVSYELLRVTKDKSGAETEAPVTIPVPFSSAGLVSYTDNVAISKVDASGLGVQLFYEYQVRAVNCSLYSDYTKPPRKWPCAFDPTVAASFKFTPAGTLVDGVGTAANPWLVSGITGIAVDWSGSVAEIHADLYPEGSTSPIDLGTFGSPISPVTFPISGTLDDVTYRVSVTVKDAGGCMLFYDWYMTESPAGCCLAPNGFATVVSRGIGTVTLSLINICDTPLTLDTEGIVVTFTSTVVKGSATKMSNATYPKTGGGTVDDPSIKGSGVSAGTIKLLGSSAVAAGASRTIPAGGTYTVTLTFSTDSFTFDCATGIYRRLSLTPPDLSSQVCHIYPATGGTTCP